ncbi:hypothetical protein EVAR_27605_1 [Eumeta japonica]|uniref:Uncharacterized protein n=1 Tax=Eumeta variegata TaxID=151549 RepID=A0A4C1V1M5_EUMVA|nr:hypothetical protein EVAR_27605_1 [Eumeta japonica]
MNPNLILLQLPIMHLILILIVVLIPIPVSAFGSRVNFALTRRLDIANSNLISVSDPDSEDDDVLCPAQDPHVHLSWIVKNRFSSCIENASKQTNALPHMQ